MANGIAGNEMIKWYKLLCNYGILFNYLQY